MCNTDWKKCIICGDSKEIIKNIPDNSIDFILTDPPYNIGKHSTGNIPLPGRTPMNNDVADWDRIDFNPEEWADEFIRILKPDGNLFIFTSYNQIGRWYDCLDKKFDTSNFMVWHKTNPAPKIFKAGFLNSCEMIFTCWNKKHKWNFISQKDMHNFIESPICMRPERLGNPKHPAQKPVSILMKMIEIASDKGDIVFDPFMGVGSIGVAALRKGRKFIGVEIDREYFNAAKLRINEEMKTDNLSDDSISVKEPLPAYGRTITEFEILKTIGKSHKEDTLQKNRNDDDGNKKKDDGAALSAIIKWAGGKEKELKIIKENLPDKFDCYYEPFVGGGSVFAAIDADRYFINDRSSELIELYKNIATGNRRFFDLAQQIIDTWERAGLFF